MRPGGDGSRKGWVGAALRASLLALVVAMLAACGSAGKRFERDERVSAPKPAPSASAPRASGGGYYQDDGPG